MAAAKARQAADRKSAETEVRRLQQRAADRAAAWWRQCLPAGESAYLLRKGLPAGRLYGARLSPSLNLVIPVQDTTGSTYGLQVIYHDPVVRKRKGRDKDFLPAGLGKKGRAFVIGALVAGRVALLCEGFATGATLHEATGLPVIVAFDANNLLPVALAYHKAYRGLRLLVCADDDYLQTCIECSSWTTVDGPECVSCGQPHKKSNAGRACAEAAAVAVAGAVATPEFPVARPLTHKGATDYNDLHVHPSGGLSMVSRQIESFLSAAGWGFAMLARVRAPETEVGSGGGRRAALRGLYTLDEACERWVLMYGGDGAYFDSVDHVLVKKNDVLALLPDHASREWKLRPDRKVARFDEVGFDPTESDPAVTCNLWGGWPTTPRRGDCQILLDLLRWMCSLEDNCAQAYDFALRWLAYPVQHRGAKMKSTLIFHGMQGTGKNIFFEAYAKIFGPYAGIVDQSAVESQFNDWLSRKLFIIFDEVVARAELYFLKNRIKSLITGDTLRINPKHLAPWVERSHFNGVWLSNEQHPAAIEISDRRHFVIWTPSAMSDRYYRETAACIASGGVEALHDYLLHLDLGDFDEHSKPPMTAAKAAVQELSAGSIERFFRDWVARDTVHPVCACASAQLYRAYVRWCGAGGEKPRSQNALSGHVGKQPGWGIQFKDVFDSLHYGGSPRRTRMVIPPESALAHPESAGHRKRPNKTEAQWATDCFFAFGESLGRGEDD